MDEGLMRVVDGVEELLCWRFAVSGKTDAVYEPANAQLGPLDPDRRRRLRPGEMFQRLSPSGHSHVYRGLSWRPKSSIPRERV